MNHVELLEKIRGMPLVEQVALAEAILHGLGGQWSRTVPVAEDRESLRRQMREGAQAAVEYYRSDPEVALWRGLEGEPYHEYETGTDLAGRSGPNSRG